MRTCGLRCSTTFSSLPLVAELCETGQPPAGQADCDTGTTEHGECGKKAPLQPHLARPRRSRTGPDGAERLDLPQMLTRYGASARGARARRRYDRIMED